MDVVIAGGHGKIALLLSSILVARGDRVRGLIRSPTHREELLALGVEPVLCDLESADHDELGRAIAGADAVVFAAGAGPGSGAARKETVDYRAAVDLIEAARAAGVPRYVAISSMGADPDRAGEEVFDAYLRAKGRADAVLAASGLDYTVVRPGPLTDEEPTGHVTIAETVERGEVPRADIAAVLAACLTSDDVPNRTLEVVGGETPIDRALRAR